MRQLSKNDLDLLMLVQPKQSNLLHNPGYSKKIYDSDIVITGKIFSEKKQLIKNAVATILSARPSLILENDTILNGNFKFELPYFNDSLLFNIQLKDFKGNNIDEFSMRFNDDSALQFHTPSYLKKTFAFEKPYGINP